MLFWNIVEGHFGDTSLDGLSIVRVGRFTGNLWGNEARGRSGVFLDERADDTQAGAIMSIFGGEAGGFPAVFTGLLVEREQVGVERAKISFEVCLGVRSGANPSDNHFPSSSYAGTAPKAGLVFQSILDGGKRYCSLFTDQSNPTSNHIYRQIGFQPRGAFVELHFEGEGPG